MLASLLVLVLPSPALAAPSLPPTFYLPTPEEVPPGFVIANTSGVGSIFGGGFEQEQHYSAPEIHLFGYSHVMVFNDREAASRRMDGSRQTAAALGTQAFTSTVGDEGYVTMNRGMYTDYFRFVVRSGLAVVETMVFFNAGVSEATAATVGQALMASTLARMAAHPDGV
jgi:hypothetical protein